MILIQWHRGGFAVVKRNKKKKQETVSYIHSNRAKNKNKFPPSISERAGSSTYSSHNIIGKDLDKVK